MGVIEEKQTVCMIHNPTSERPRRGAGDRPRRSVNSDLYWEQVPGFELSDVSDTILLRVLEGED